MAVLALESFINPTTVNSHYVPFRTHLLKIFEYDSQEDWAVFEETEDRAAEEMQ